MHSITINNLNENRLAPEKTIKFIIERSNLKPKSEKFPCSIFHWPLNGNRFRLMKLGQSKKKG